MGTMSFGTWSDRSESFRILDTAFDRGINFFDTAEIYPVPPTAEVAGLSEEQRQVLWLGREFEIDSTYAAERERELGRVRWSTVF